MDKTTTVAENEQKTISIPLSPTDVGRVLDAVWRQFNGKTASVNPDSQQNWSELYQRILGAQRAAYPADAFTDPDSPVDDELMEKLAAIEHERWAHWQSWCHKVLREQCPSPELERVLERWDKQIATPYEALSETEKESDREQVRRYWHLIRPDAP